MTTRRISGAMRAAGAIHVGIMVRNVPLPRRFPAKERLAGGPRFLRQIFSACWIYIALLLGMFAALPFRGRDGHGGSQRIWQRFGTELRGQR